MSMDVANAVQRALRGEPVGFAGLLAEARKKKSQARAAIGEIGDAVILKQHGDERWAFCLADVEGRGRWRLQFFDTRGFSGHIVYASKEEAVNDALVMGYSVRDDDALDRLQDTVDFRVGLFSVEQIARVNSGAIEMKDYVQSVKAYRAQLEAASI